MIELQTLHRDKASMRMQLTADGIELTPELGEYVQRRIHFGLGRFSRRIVRLWVHLTNANGPGIGLDKCCTIRVDAGLSQAVAVIERQDDIHAAVALAVERAARTVERRLQLLGRTEPNMRPASPRRLVDDKA